MKSFQTIALQIAAKALVNLVLNNQDAIKEKIDEYVDKVMAWVSELIKKDPNEETFAAPPMPEGCEETCSAILAGIEEATSAA